MRFVFGPQNSIHRMVRRSQRKRRDCFGKLMRLNLQSVLSVRMVRKLAFHYPNGRSARAVPTVSYWEYYSLYSCGRTNHIDARLNYKWIALQQCETSVKEEVRSVN